MKRLFQNTVPLAAVCAVGICLAAGVAAAYTTVLVAVMVASIMFCNPFGLLDVALAVKARRCMGAGIVLFLLAFVQPFGWPVAVFLVTVGFAVLYFGLRYNKRLFKEQMLPFNRMKPEVMHSPYVDQVISQMNADPKNLGPARQYWNNSGIRQYRALMHLRGISVTEEEIARVAEGAFCLGLSLIQKRNQKMDDLRTENDRLREELRYQKAMTREAEERCAQVRIDLEEQRRETEKEHYRAEQADDRIYALSAVVSQNESDALTGERILELLKEPGMTQRKISEQFGISTSVINRRKKAAEARQKEHNELVERFMGRG